MGKANMRPRLQCAGAATHPRPLLQGYPKNGSFCSGMLSKALKNDTLSVSVQFLGSSHQGLSAGNSQVFKRPAFPLFGMAGEIALKTYHSGAANLEKTRTHGCNRVVHCLPAEFCQTAPIINIKS